MRPGTRRKKQKRQRTLHQFCNIYSLIQPKSRSLQHLKAWFTHKTQNLPSLDKPFLLLCHFLHVEAVFSASLNSQNPLTIAHCRSLTPSASHRRHIPFRTTMKRHPCNSLKNNQNQSFCHFFLLFGKKKKISCRGR